MNILLVLIPVSLLLVGLALWAFFWAVDAGQFDDLDSPSLMALAEPTLSLQDDRTDTEES